MPTNSPLDCTLQLGFDFSAQNGLLQAGLVNTSGSSQVFLTDLPSVADTNTTLTFAFLDMTSTPIGGARVSVTMIFSAADSQDEAKPLDPQPSGDSYTWTTDTVSSVVSVVFDGRILNEFTNSSGDNVFTLNTNGSFTFTIEATVTPDDTTLAPQNFTLDPEMIVGSGNMGDGDGDDMKKPPAKSAQPESPATRV